jgi:hypothetical protein
MSGGDRIKTNKNLRARIELYVRGCQPGTSIDGCNLARQLSDRRRNITPLRVSALLREREGLRHDARNKWIVVV